MVCVVKTPENKLVTIYKGLTESMSPYLLRDHDRQTESLRVI